MKKESFFEKHEDVLSELFEWAVYFFAAFVLLKYNNFWAYLLAAYATYRFIGSAQASFSVSGPIGLLAQIVTTALLCALGVAATGYFSVTTSVAIIVAMIIWFFAEFRHQF